MKGQEILLVEDRDEDVFLTKRALTKANITNEVIVAKDGVEAIKYLIGDRDKPTPGGKPCPVLILLDLNLPRINGLEVLKRIRGNETTLMCPVVILTSSREETDIVSGCKLGANSFIRKPVNFDQFAEAVRQMGLYWLVLNEPPPLKTQQ